MSSILLAALVIGAPPANTESAATAAYASVISPSDVRESWRTRVTEALRQHALSDGGDVVALLRIVRLADELQAATTLSRPEHQRLLAKLNRRIERATSDLVRHMRRRQTRIEAADSAKLPRTAKQMQQIAEDRAVLAQQLDFLRQFGGGAAPGGGVSNGDALVELIQKAVHPESWEVNGGSGTIVIFRR